MKWYWMRRDRHTGWMVPCSLQPVYVKKYVKWKHEGEVCVDVRLLVFLDWRATSWRWRGRSRNVYQSTCRRWIFVCFYLFSTLGCVFVCLWEMVWCGVYILFFVFCFCYCCYTLYHSVPLQSFSLKFCTFLGRIGMQAYGLLLSM